MVLVTRTSLAWASAATRAPGRCMTSSRGLYGFGSRPSHRTGRWKKYASRLRTRTWPTDGAPLGQMAVSQWAAAIMVVSRLMLSPDCRPHQAAHSPIALASRS